MTDATGLVNEYNALTDTQKGYVSNSTDWTYNGSDTAAEKVDVPFDDIIARLKAISGGSGAVVLNPGNGDNMLAIVIVMASVSVLVAASFIIILKKRKPARK